MKRRVLLQYISLLFGASILGGLTACGSEDSPPPPQPNNDDNGDLDNGDGGSDPDPEKPNACESGSQVVYTNPGHGHTTIALTAEELDQAMPAVYQLMGGNHVHNFELTAEDFINLNAGQTINKDDLELHGHVIAITCG